jgi:hypothetical protein
VLVEAADQIMPGFMSKTMAAIAEKHLAENGGTVKTAPTGDKPFAGGLLMPQTLETSH